MLVIGKRRQRLAMLVRLSSSEMPAGRAQSGTISRRRLLSLTVVALLAPLKVAEVFRSLFRPEDNGIRGERNAK